MDKGIKLRKRDKLLRIVFRDQCPSAHPHEMTESIFFDYDKRELSFFLLKITTVEKVIADYLENRKSDRELVGVTAISVRAVRKFGIVPKLTGVDGDPHVAVKWTKEQHTNRVDMRAFWLSKAKRYGLIKY